MAKVWVVEFGEYSSRMVYGVFSTEENARIAAGSSGDVTEFETDPGITLYRDGLRVFHVEMFKDGNVKKVEQSEHMARSAPYFSLCIRDLPGKNELYVVDHVSGTLWAKDQEQAIKATNEQRAQFIATGEWDAFEDNLNKPRKQKVLQD